MRSLDTHRDAAIIGAMQRVTRTKTRIGVLLLAAAIAAAGGAQITAAGGGAGGQAAGGAAPQAGGQPPRPGLYPALQRPPGDPELIARGRGIYGINCRACHGVDLRGGDLGGPNLLRSQLVLRDLQGELMGPVIQNGSTAADGSGMPPQPLSDEDVRAVAEYIHDVLSTATRQGGPPEGEAVELDILVGDAAAGEAYFAAQCASCHSPDGDLRGLASRIAEPRELQNTWVRGGSRTGPRPPVDVTVTTSAGERVEGTLERLDDFVVVLTTADGRHRSFSRRGGGARIELADPLARHRELLSVYSDADIHNLTAYLVTLK
jgi:cytochrome c oxidase cbb3-type subunit 3